MHTNAYTLHASTMYVHKSHIHNTYFTVPQKGCAKRGSNRQITNK